MLQIMQQMFLSVWTWIANLTKSLKGFIAIKVALYGFRIKKVENDLRTSLYDEVYICSNTIQVM